MKKNFFLVFNFIYAFCFGNQTENNRQDATNYKMDECYLHLSSEINLTESCIQKLIKDCSSITEIGLSSENFTMNILRSLSKKNHIICAI